MWRVLLLSAVVACTKPNPEVCCLDEADCASIGVSDPARDCAEGLACVDHQCAVPTCSTEGCGPEAPVCDIRTDVCAGCLDSTECARFQDTSVCEPNSGACVQCVVPTDCAAATPVCEANTCRVCVLDTECDSGACGEDGACVDEARAIYLSPTGTDAGGCTRAAPCRTLKFAAGRAAGASHHLVLEQGTYNGGANAGTIDATATSATRIVVHGHGAQFAAIGDGAVLNFRDVSFLIRDVMVIDQGQQTLQGLSITNTVSRMERVTITNSGRILSGGDVTIVDSSVANAFNEGINFGGKLTLDRVVISGGVTGLTSNAGMIDATNLLVFGTSGVALDLSNATGVVRFSTLINKVVSGTGPAVVLCSGGITVQASIVWAPNTSRIPIGGTAVGTNCTLSSTIAGPTAVAGATSTDPQFVNEDADDYHLTPNSPARDVVDIGPELDFERDARPRGARFDLGADEAP